MSEDTFPVSGALAPPGGFSDAGAAVAGGSAGGDGRLGALALAASGCVRCAQLAAGRTQVVFGEGDPGADVVFVGDAPARAEDLAGRPLVGAAGRLFDELLASIGLERADVYVTTVLKCAPPGNRDASSSERDRCRPYLDDQVALLRPRVVCTLGDVATRLLLGTPAGIRERHGRDAVVTIGGTAVRVLPLFHPSAALYTRALREVLAADMARLPELLARPAPPQPVPEVLPEPEADEATESATAPTAEDDSTSGPSEQEATTSAPSDEPPAGGQLGLF